MPGKTRKSKSKRVPTPAGAPSSSRTAPAATSRQKQAPNTSSSTRDSSSSNSAPQATLSRRKQSNPIKRSQFTDMHIFGKTFKVSVNILKEIRRLQANTNTVIPRAPFARLVREILQDHGRDIRVQLSMLQTLQEATEMYLHQFFEDSYLCTQHARRVTLVARDMQLVKRLRQNSNVL